MFNYGKRLMFEVLVPEPAAFVRYAIEKNKVSEPGPKEPTKPGKPEVAISTLDQSTIDTYSALYSLHEPPETIRQTMTIQQSGLGSASAVHQVVAVVPEGYVADRAEIDAAGTNHATNSFTMFVGGAMTKLWENTTNLVQSASREGPSALTFPGISTQLAASIHTYGVDSYSVSIVVTVTRSDAYHRTWQIKMYNRIIKAYEDLLAKYEAAFALYQRQLDTFNARKRSRCEG